MLTSTITITFSIPENISNELKDINNFLSKKYKSEFKTEFISYRPHITIYQIEIPSDQEIIVLEQLKKIVSEPKKIFFQIKEITIRGKYVALNFVKSLDIQKFHTKVVKTLNKYRKGIIKSKYDKLENFTEIEKNNVLNYGYPFVLDAYNPHTTIILLENEGDIKKVIKEINYNEKFFIDALTIVISKNNIDGESKKEFHNLYFNN